MRRTAVVVALVLGSVWAGPGLPHSAAANTTCTFEDTVYASPGLTTQPSSGTVSTKGEHETITCDGPVNGKQPSGPGTVGYEGRYGTKDGDTCQQGGEGDGVFSFTVPSSDGPQHIDDNTTYTYGAFKAGSPFAGSLEGERLSGTFEVQPVDGDCASAPVTKFTVKGKVTIKK